jgi:hypothetical protein
MTRNMTFSLDIPEKEAATPSSRTIVSSVYKHAGERRNMRASGSRTFAKQEFPAE